MIEFTQYLLPDGRTRPLRIQRGEFNERCARILQEAGYRFEAEVLTTGDVSLTVERGEDETVAIEVVPNGPGVSEAVDKLVARAWVEFRRRNRRVMRRLGVDPYAPPTRPPPPKNFLEENP